MNKLMWLLISAVLLILAGCAALNESGGAAQFPTVSQVAAAGPGPTATSTNTTLARSSTGGLAAQPGASSCTIPTGWVPYQMQLNETIYSVASRAMIGADTLLRANCRTSIAGVGPGTWLYIPADAATTAPQTLLPLGISAMVVDPVEARAGEQVQLAWQAQGPVVSVRAGWLDGTRYVELAGDLPAIGTHTVTVPDAGREHVTFVVRVSDGLREVVAQSMVRLRCDEGWFFTPAPNGCPFPPLVTRFYEQRFERGTVIYAPALGIHYAFLNGHPARLLEDPAPTDTFPGPVSAEASVPAGMGVPTGTLGAIWRGDEILRGTLGYTLGQPTAYMGMLQRVSSALGEVIYLAGGDGLVYQFADGGNWGTLTPQ